MADTGDTTSHADAAKRYQQTRNPSIMAELQAPLRFDEKVLKFIKRDNDTTQTAIVVMIIAKLLDITGIITFNIRIFNGIPDNLILILLYPLFVAYTAVIMSQVVRIYGLTPKIEESFRLLCFAMIWSIVAWPVFLIVELLPEGGITTALNLAATAGAAFGYFSTIALGLRSSDDQDFMVVALFVVLSVAVAAILPFLMYLLVLAI